MRKFATFSKIATWALLLGILALVWFPAVAYAQDAAPVPTEQVGPASELLFSLLKIVFTILGLVATYLTVKAIAYFEKKTKIDIPAATEKTIDEWADRAVGFAHEKSHQVLKQTGKKLDGNEKLSLATGFVNDMVKKHKLAEITEAKLKDYVEAKLGTKRIEGEAVTESPAPSPVVTP
mgnify:CR=1 FL=1